VPDDAGYSESLRLTFAYRENDIHLLRVERLKGRSLAPFTQPPGHDRVGHWVELRDSDHRLLYHRPLHDPMRGSIESFGDAPGAEIHRVMNPARSGEFQVRVPDLPAAHELLIHDAAGDAGPQHSVVPLVRQDFAELRAAAERPPAPPDHTGGSHE